MRGDDGGVDEQFAGYVRARGEHLLRVAVLLTGDWHAAEDLVRASLVKLYRSWPRLDTSADPDAYLRRIMVNTHRSWWRARWRRETPTAVLPGASSVTTWPNARRWVPWSGRR
jgi:DNA-directed RNA polymerase specialized sigma24 family protein